MDDFGRCLAIVLKLEGGDTVTRDSGGITRWGVSSRAHPTVDIENLTYEEARDIYENEYWGPSGASECLWPMSLVVMDAAVNQGVGFAQAVASEALDYSEAIVLRMVRYTTIAQKNHDLRIYFRGWINRLARIWEECRRVETVVA